MSFLSKLFGKRVQATETVQTQEGECVKAVVNVSNNIMSSKPSLGVINSMSSSFSGSWIKSNSVTTGVNMFNVNDVEEMEKRKEKVVSDFVKEKLNIKQECLDLLNIKISRFDPNDQTVYIYIDEGNVCGWVKPCNLKNMCEGVENLLTKIEMLEAINKQSSNNPDGRRKL